MNITQSYVSLFFFWLGSCPLGLKVFHWERKLLSFLDFDCFQYFGGIYIYLNSVLLVFLFSGFLFSFSFLGDKHGCLISEIRPWQDFCLKNDRLWISRTLLRAPPRTCPGEGVVLARHRSSAHRSVFSWTVVSQVPVLDPSSHQTSSYEKEKKRKKFL